HGVSLVYAAADSIRNRTVDAGESFEFPGSVDWAGQESKFFTALMIPDRSNTTMAARAYIDRKNEADEYRLVQAHSPMNLDLIHQAREVAEGERATLVYQLYVGPKNREALSDKTFVLA